MRRFRADLHVHTCLSPCADLDMHPARLVENALTAGLDIIAITDHNSAENVGYVRRAASSRPLTVLGGLEICSREEVHLLALFDDDAALNQMQTTVYAHLDGANDPERFGLQVVANELGEVEGFNERLLIGATDLSLENLVSRIHELGGLSIAAHIDRPAFGILSQLGFIPSELELDAVELSWRAPADHPSFGRPVVRSSDAHYPLDLGRATTIFELEEPTLAEIRLALDGRQGRCIVA